MSPREHKEKQENDALESRKEKEIDAGKDGKQSRGGGGGVRDNELRAEAGKSL